MYTYISANMYTVKLFNLMLSTILIRLHSLLLINTAKLLESAHSLIFPKPSNTANHITSRTQIIWR